MQRARLLLLALCVSLCAEGLPAAAGPSPTAEFEAPYAIGILAGGETVEITGSFSWAMPQAFGAVLAQAPSARAVRFASPGGHIQPALEIAAIIRARGLDTEAARICASACTLAFLGGRRRTLGPEAWLGFHQAQAPGVPPERLDPVMRQAYAKSGVPAGFIDHVLRTPPQSVWFPTHAELLAARIITAPAPEPAAPAVAAGSELRTVMAMTPRASDAAVAEFAAALAAVLAHLQSAGPETCWGFLNDAPTDLRAFVKAETIMPLTRAATHVREDATRAPTVTPDPVERARVLSALVTLMRANGHGDAPVAMGPAGVHALACPSLRILLESALALPDASRAATLRALLATQ